MDCPAEVDGGLIKFKFDHPVVLKAGDQLSLTTQIVSSDVSFEVGDYKIVYGNNTNFSQLPSDEYVCMECGATIKNCNQYMHGNFHMYHNALKEKVQNLESILDRLAQTEGLSLSDLIGHDLGTEWSR